MQALASNSGGTLLALTSTVAGPWMFVSGVLGRWWLRQPNEWFVVAVAAIVVVVTLIDWGYRLAGASF